MRRTTFVVSLLVGLVGVCAPAGAQGWSELAQSFGAPVHAGDGLVVAEVDEHQVAVVGPRGIGRRYDIGPSCNVRSAGGGRVALRCTTANSWEYKLLDLAAGSITAINIAPDVKDRIVGGAGLDISAIGRHWAQTIVDGNHYFGYAYWNPVTNAFPSAPTGSRWAFDLDDPSGVAPLCSPVRPPEQTWTPMDSGTSYPSSIAQLQRTGRWQVYFPGRDEQGRPGRTRLFAWRCGHRRPILVSRCRDLPRGCSAFDARQNLVAWRVPRGVRVMDLASGRRSLLRGRFEYAQAVIGRGKHIYVLGERGPDGKYPLLVKQMESPPTLNAPPTVF